MNRFRCNYFYILWHNTLLRFAVSKNIGISIKCNQQLAKHCPRSWISIWTYIIFCQIRHVVTSLLEDKVVVLIVLTAYNTVGPNIRSYNLEGNLKQSWSVMTARSWKFENKKMCTPLAQYPRLYYWVSREGTNLEESVGVNDITQVITKRASRCTLLSLFR